MTTPLENSFRSFISLRRQALAACLLPTLLLSGCEDTPTTLEGYTLAATAYGEQGTADASSSTGRTHVTTIPDRDQTVARTKSFPHKRPSATPGDFDPSFESRNGLRLIGGAAFDSSEAHTGSQSIYLNSPGDAFEAGMTAVEEDQWYTVSGYMKLDSVPKPITNILIQIYDKSGRWAYNAADYTFSVSANRKWEEFVAPVYIKRLPGRELGFIKINIRYKENPDSTRFHDASVWIDDLRISRAKDSSQLFGFEKPEARTPFMGQRTRIDSLGNWEVFDHGEWSPLFPLIIYPDFQETDWSKYREKGFNTVSQIKYAGGAKRATDAGLYWMWDITSYLYSADAFPGSNPSTGDTARLQREFDRFERETGFDGMLAFYWDNEDLNEWDSVQKITDRLKTLDTAASTEGERRFPIYMNSKHTLANPLFMNDDYSFIDIQGCYVNPMTNPHTKGYQSEWAMFLANDKMARLKSPTGIGVINVPHEGDHIESLIFAGIARGMRGFAFWRDGYQGKYSIESRAWWPTFRQTTEKIEDMLPLIRQPHWTDWALESSIPEREDTLVIGKRDLDGKRHIILASLSDRPQTVTLTTDKTIDGVYDYFTGDVVALPEGKRFDFTIEAHGTAVLRLE